MTTNKAIRVNFDFMLSSLLSNFLNTAFLRELVMLLIDFLIITLVASPTPESSVSSYCVYLTEIMETHNKPTVRPSVLYFLQ